MEIKDVIHLIRKWWVLIFGLFAASLVAAAIISFYFMQNIYESTAVMIISSPRDKASNPLTLNDYNLNIKLVNSYRVLCKTDKILSQVLSETGMTLTTKELAEKINVTAQNDTEIINIAAQDTNPATAAKLANIVANVFVKEIPDIMQMSNVQIIDNAVESKVPVKPDRKMILAIAGFLGLLLGFGIALLIEYFDITIKSTEQLTTLMEAPVLGTVPRMQERSKQ